MIPRTPDSFLQSYGGVALFNVLVGFALGFASAALIAGAL